MKVLSTLNFKNHEYKHEAISQISLAEVMSPGYLRQKLYLDISGRSYILDIQVGKVVSPNSLPGRGGRISGVRLHSVALHLLSKQHPHLTATRWVYSQILGKKISQVLSHITASYCPTSYLVHTVYGDLNLHKVC